jgi:hypothetical protein
MQLICCALVLACLSSSCSSVRAAFMKMNNASQVGDIASPLTGAEWVSVDPDVDEAEPDADWRLLVFMRPT